ncbi:MAG: XRE family transcriptional regulator [Roseburia hominis]|nr:XRE family transcriptional regulator [Roseburia hominis]
MLSDASFPATFPDYLMAKMQCADMSAAELISRAQIQRNYGYQILDGRRNPSRDKVIAFSLALHLDVNETQRALMIEKNGQLYSKNKRDSILIFALGKKLSVIQTNELLYEMGEALLS